MRWTTPIHQFVRRAACDAEVAGQRVAKGERVVLCFPSGNRDEEVFPDPFEFRADRSPNRHIGFGFGAHACLGVHLARIEMAILFEELLPRIASLELAGEPKRTVTNFVGGPKSLPVRMRLRHRQGGQRPTTRSRCGGSGCRAGARHMLPQRWERPSATAFARSGGDWPCAHPADLPKRGDAEPCGCASRWVWPAEWRSRRAPRCTAARSPGGAVRFTSDPRGCDAAGRARAAPGPLARRARRARAGAQQPGRRPRCSRRRRAAPGRC